MLRVHLLGGVALEVDGRPGEPPESRRARAVMAWLALHPGRHSRVEVAGRFWPELPDSSARGNLRLAVWAIRRSLGPGADAQLLTTRDELGLLDDEALWVDMLEFRRLVKAGRYEEALALDRGEPLAGLEDEWVYEARDAHREHASEALGGLAAQAEERGELTAALAWTRRQVELDPLGEEPARELMRRLVAIGDRGAALSAYERLRERLDRELAIAPSRATRELAYSLGAEPAAPAAAARVAQPPARGVPFVGRAHELARLRGELGRAQGGEMRVVLLGGEPGIGKTRLAAELAREASAAGALVLSGHNDEETVVPFQPFVEAFGRWARDTPRDGLAAILGESAADLRRLVPEVDRRLPAPPAGRSNDVSERYRMFESVAGALASLSRPAPVVLILDDLHWAERATLLLLKHLARSDAGAALLVLATFREPAPADLADLLADLRRDPSVSRLRLRGLDEASVSELLSEWSGRQPPPGLTRALQRDTGGNPFFLQETLRHLDEAGLLRDARGHWRLGIAIEDSGVAEGVREVVSRRLSTLSEPCRRLLDLAAVIGRRCDLELLARISGSPPDAVADTLDEAVRAHVLTEGGDPGEVSYAFGHALIRQTLYEDLPRGRRVRLHRAIADAIEDLHRDDLEPHLGDLASHVLRSARPRDAGRALDYARRAGLHAMRLFAHEDAVGHFRRALEALSLGSEPDEPTRCELLLDLGTALARSGDQSEAVEAFDQAATSARRLGRHDLLVAAALGFAGTWALARVRLEPRSVAMLQDALSLLDEDEPALRARLLTRLSEELYYSPERTRRVELSEEALRLARRHSDAASLARALGARHTAIWGQRPVEERLALAGEMLRLGSAAEDPEITFQGLAWSYADLLELARAVEAADALERLGSLAERLRQPAYSWWASMIQATHALLTGDFAAAEQRNEEAAFWGERAEIRAAVMYTQGQLHYIRVEQGRAQEIVEAMQRGATEFPSVPSLRCMLAEALAESGDEEAARREVRSLAEDATALALMNASWSIGMYSLAMACAKVGEVELAERLYGELIPHRERVHVAFRAASSTGSVERTLGVLAATAGMRGEAEQHLSRAIEVNERIGALAQLGRTRRDLDGLTGSVAAEQRAARA